LSYKVRYYILQHSNKECAMIFISQPCSTDHPIVHYSKT